MSNLDHAIWWHVYPLGACGAPLHPDGPDPAPRLRVLEDWLDYVVELGCSGLLLGPIFASGSHGYDTLDHFRIDPRLGEDADFDRLIEQCRRRGLSVILDGVFNHVSAGHSLVAEAVRDQAGLIKLADGPDGRRPVGWEGHDDLVELDHANPAVADLVVSVMLHWLERGASGWRLDVAYAVPPQFWAPVIDRVRQQYDQAIFLGEVIHGDYAAIAADSHFDTVTQYELWKAVWSSISDRNLWELAWALQRHGQFAETFLPQTFVGNHDVDRIASLVGDHGAALAAVVLCTLPGVPSIYYGDEQGFRGTKGIGWGADDPLRPALPATPTQLAPEGWWLYRLYQELIGLRRRNAWLAHGVIEVVDKTNTSIHYTLSDSSHQLSARLSLDPQPQASIEVDGQPSWHWPR